MRTPLSVKGNVVPSCLVFAFFCVPLLSEGLESGPAAGVKGRNDLPCH